jgi:hypothetical protein
MAAPQIDQQGGGGMALGHSKTAPGARLIRRTAVTLCRGEGAAEL